jgi:hypothetical protein
VNLGARFLVSGVGCNGPGNPLNKKNCLLFLFWHNHDIIVASHDTLHVSKSLCVTKLCGTPNYYKEIPKLFLLSQTIFGFQVLQTNINSPSAPLF